MRRTTQRTQRTLLTGPKRLTIMEFYSSITRLPCKPLDCTGTCEFLEQWSEDKAKFSEQGTIAMKSYGQNTEILAWYVANYGADIQAVILEWGPTWRIASILAGVSYVLNCALKCRILDNTYYLKIKILNRVNKIKIEAAIFVYNRNCYSQLEKQHAIFSPKVNTPSINLVLDLFGRI